MRLKGITIPTCCGAQFLLREEICERVFGHRRGLGGQRSPSYHTLLRSDHEIDN